MVLLLSPMLTSMYVDHDPINDANTTTNTNNIINNNNNTLTNLSNNNHDNNNGDNHEQQHPNTILPPPTATTTTMNGTTDNTHTSTSTSTTSLTPNTQTDTPAEARDSLPTTNLDSTSPPTHRSSTPYDSETTPISPSGDGDGEEEPDHSLPYPEEFKQTLSQNPTRNDVVEMANRDKILQTIAGVSGNVLEWYDFAVFGYFADIIGDNFFPPQAGHRQLMETFAVFGIAFLMRPGEYYDDVSVLVLTVFIVQSVS